MTRSTLSRLLLALGLVLGVGVGTTTAVAPASRAGASTSARSDHAVPVDCTADGADQRTTVDSSVQPGVIVADSTLVPYGPITYTPYTIDDTGHPQVIGPFSTIDTADHLVSVWENSTDCFGNADSRNAWVLDASGAVFGENDLSGPPAANMGGMAGHRLNQPMVGMSPTSDGAGYWLVAADGGIFTFGDAHFLGSTGGTRLNEPIVGMSVTGDSDGYWLVATDGGIFTFGDAPFFGSLGSLKLNRPIEGMTATPDGRGYWLVASDGGIFCFGDAQFHGSLGGRALSAPISGMIPNGSGYTLIGQDGQTYPF